MALQTLPILVAMARLWSAGDTAAEMARAEIEIQPSAWHFGEIWLGETIEVPVTIRNCGDLPVSVWRLSFMGCGNAPPVGECCIERLPPGQTTVYRMKWTPRRAGRMDARFEFEGRPVAAKGL
ncbi:MAG: hypothetical protein SF069_18530 [Phycisphaerae bacterium]|nr:hypothetical protein [Phycisphaerae bacterium]